jgi:hypothetical protein
MSKEANDQVADEVKKLNPAGGASYADMGQKFRDNHTTYMPQDLRQALTEAQAEWDGNVFVEQRLIR